MKTTVGQRVGLPELPRIFSAGRIGAWFRKINPLLYFCSLALIASLLLGGGSKPGYLSDVILQLLAIPPLLYALWRLLDVPLTKGARQALWLCAAVVAIPLIQLVPLPPALWTALPHRGPLVETYTILGQAVPWMPISVSPQATWLSLVSLLPPLAMFLGVLQLGYRERRALTLVLLSLGLLSAFLGLLQVAQGPESGLRFFAQTNPSEAVGFFANRNHFAALIYSAMLLTVAWIVSQVTALQSRSEAQGALRFDVPAILGLIASVTALVVLLAAEFMARSRAGLGLTMLALLGVAALGYFGQQAGFGASLNKLLVGAVALVLIFSLQFALYRVLERIPDTLRDDRPILARTTLEAAKAYTPFGSGVGTFVPVYAMFEKPAEVRSAYVNNPANDLLVLWLEAGVFGLALLAVFVIWLLRRSIQIWRTRPSDASDLDWSIARGATMIPALLLIHSFVDYPLRTGAMMGVMAFACALLIAPQLAEGTRERDELQRLREQLARRKSTALVSTQSTALPTLRPPVVTTSVSVKPPVATLPSPSPETKSESPPPTHQRWGADIEWPKAWSQSGTTQQGDERASQQGDERASQQGDEKASQQGDEKASQQGDEKKEP